jgi:hypothetical protein
MTRKEIIDWHRAHPYGARDSQYMDAVLDHIKKRWLESPKQRLGQLLVNAGRSQNGTVNGDVFYVPDEDWVP